MLFDRRRLLATAPAALAFSGLARHAAAQAAGEETYVNQVHGYGPLVRDPNRLLDLPEGFTYQVVSQSGIRPESVGRRSMRAKTASAAPVAKMA